MTECGEERTGAQHVEGFDRAIVGRSIEMREYSADARGRCHGWAGDLWWEVGTHPLRQDLVWETAPCRQQVGTVFSFDAATACMPYGTEAANQAKLYVNDAYALTFDLGQTAEASWEEGGFGLCFSPQRVQTPFEGYHRQFEMSGVSGNYRLAVPAEHIIPGERARIRVALLPPVVDCINWFAILDRRDTLQVSVEALQEQVRVLQQDGVRLRNMVNVLAKKAYPELFPEALEAEHTLIYANGRKWVGVPDIVKLRAGDLLLTFREAIEHVSNDGTICTLRSSDGGRSWYDYQVVVATPGTDHRDASVAELHDGSLVMTWFPMLGCDEQTGVMLPSRQQPRGPRGPNKIHVLHSTDNGHTWEDEHVIDPTPFIWNHTAEPCIQLPNGRVLAPLYGETAEKRLATTCFCSDDNGYTWQYLSTMMVRPEGDLHLLEYLETTMVLTDSGKIVAISRTEKDGMWQTTSSDLGQTWDAPRRLPMPPHTQPNLTKSSDGRLLLAYGHRYTTPCSIRVHISEDEGQHWGDPLVLRDDFPNFDLGYACCAELEPGVILTVYWYNLFGRFALGGTVWRLPPVQKS